MTHYIYCISNILNNKSYVGQSRNTTKRFSNHKWSSVGYHLNGERAKNKLVIHKAISKHGLNNFKFQELCSYETIEEANEAEIFFIQYLNTISPNGYNIAEGGDFKHHTEESKRKIGLGHTIIADEIVIAIYMECYNGASEIDVANKYNVSVNSVSKYLAKDSRKHTLKDLPDIPKGTMSGRKNKLTKENVEELRKEYTVCGYQSITDMHTFSRQQAIKYGVHPSTILRKLGLSLSRGRYLSVGLSKPIKKKAASKEELQSRINLAIQQIGDLVETHEVDVQDLQNIADILEGKANN